MLPEGPAATRHPVPRLSRRAPTGRKKPRFSPGSRGHDSCSWPLLCSIRSFPGGNTQMKKTLLSLSFALVAMSSVSFADLVEVPVGHVFVPQTGYGSNNNVEVTLDGYLPNSCYQLGAPAI